MRPQIRNLVQTSEPAEEPVDLARVKSHLNVSIDDDDDLITGYIAAAREWCEKELRRAFVTRSYDVLFDGFYSFPREFLTPEWQERPSLPIWGAIQLPKPPLIAIDAITYLDPNGNPTVLPPSQYRVIKGGRGAGTLTPAYGFSWPISRIEIGSVVISYHAGYGTAQNVPQAIQSAILLIVGGLYRFREPVTDVAMIPIPFTVKALLSTHRWN